MRRITAASIGTVAASSAISPVVAKRDEKHEDHKIVPTLSTTNRLEDRRYVVAGSRAYIVGTEDGRFPAMGFHTRGEMGGIWSPPIKLLDGIWFGIDGEWLEPAERFTSSYGHTEMELPDRDGFEVTRTDFVPDGTRVALFGLHLSADQDERITLMVDARSELMNSYPWGATTPSQSEYNLADEGEFDGQRLLFREQGRPPVENAQRHDWAAVVGATHEPVDGETGDGFWGPQAPPKVAPAEGDAPERYNDTAFGNGTGGQLRYEIDLSAGETTTVWIAVAGTDFDGPEPDDAKAAALDELDAALEDPGGACEEKSKGGSNFPSEHSFPFPATGSSNEPLIGVNRISPIACSRAWTFRFVMSILARAIPRRKERSHERAFWLQAIPTILAVRHRRRIHGIRERRRRTVRTDQRPLASAARRKRDPQRRLGESRS